MSLIGFAGKVVKEALEAVGEGRPVSADVLAGRTGIADTR